MTMPVGTCNSPKTARTWRSSLATIPYWPKRYRICVAPRCNHTKSRYLLALRTRPPLQGPKIPRVKKLSFPTLPEKGALSPKSPIFQVKPYREMGIIWLKAPQSHFSVTFSLLWIFRGFGLCGIYIGCRASWIVRDLFVWPWSHSIGGCKASWIACYGVALNLDTWFWTLMMWLWRHEVHGRDWHLRYMHVLMESMNVYGGLVKSIPLNFEFRILILNATTGPHHHNLSALSHT